jgi:hypothetical protein
MTNVSPKDIIVLVRHPHGDVETTLNDWMKTGPGPRELVAPVAARDARSGVLLSLSVVPLRYRNSRLSRTLIRLGLLEDPWR